MFMKKGTVRMEKSTAMCPVVMDKNYMNQNFKVKVNLGLNFCLEYISKYFWYQDFLFLTLLTFRIDFKFWYFEFFVYDSMSFQICIAHTSLSMFIECLHSFKASNML